MLKEGDYLSNEQNITTKFKADVSDLKKGITEAKKEIKSAKAEFKNASAGMDDWTKSADGLDAKLSELKKTLQAQEKIVDSYKKQLQQAEKYEQESAESVKELKEELEKAKKEYGNTSDEVVEYEKKLAKAEKAHSSLENEIYKLRNSLNYAEADFKSTQKAINNYEDDLEHLGDTADGVDDKIEEVGTASESASTKAESAGGGGFTVMKGALAELVAEGVEKAIEAIGELIDVMGELDEADAMFEAWGDSTGALQSTAEAVYKSGITDESLSEVAKRSAKVSSYASNVSDEDLAKVTQWSYVIEKYYDEDAEEALKGMNKLMESFGLTADEAMDYMTKGYQNGLNYSNEFGDNLNEYSGIFANMGYSVDEYFNLLQTGADNGAYNLDKVNDLFKEINTRLTSGDMDEDIGMFGEEAQLAFERFKNGEIDASEMAKYLIQDIANTTDEAEATYKVTEGLGTQAEDLGVKTVKSLAGIVDAYGDVKGAADSVIDADLDTYEGKWTSLKNTIKVDLVGAIKDELEPHLGGLLDKMNEKLPEIINWMNDTLFPYINETLIPYIDNTVIPKISEIGTSVGEYITPYVQDLKNFISGDLKDGAEEVFRFVTEELFPFFQEHILPLFEAVYKLWKESLYPVFKEVLEYLWGYLKDPILPVLGDLFDIFTIIVGAIQDMFDLVVNSTLAQAFLAVLKDWLEAIKVLLKVFKKIKEVLEWIFETDWDTKLQDATEFFTGTGTSPDQYYSYGVYAEGGVVPKGQMALLEGQGTEAVVPLEKNKYWIDRVAKEMSQAQNFYNNTTTTNTTNNTSFNQTINTTDTVSRKDIYRQTKNLLEYYKRRS